MEVQKKQSNPPNLLGIDYGKRFVGLAISSGILSMPLMSLGTKEAVTRIPLLIKQHAIDSIIIGMPGGYLEKEVREFGGLLQNSTGVPVVFADETLTSHEASLQPNSGKHDEHARAAALILERYLST